MVFSRTDVNETVTSPFTIQRFWLGGKKILRKGKEKKGGRTEKHWIGKLKNFHPLQRREVEGGGRLGSTGLLGDKIELCIMKILFFPQGGNSNFRILYLTRCAELVSYYFIISMLVYLYCVYNDRI